MRKNLLLIFGIFLFINCSRKYIQIYDTNIKNAVNNKDYWVYETDSLKITYSFWANKGILSFSIYNKLDKPIFVDWKNSSFIFNDKKINYWIDEQQTSSRSYYSSYYYNGPLIKAGLAYSEGIQNTNSITIKPEKTTFIPPKSFYYRSQFYLMPNAYYKLDSLKSNKKIIMRNDNLKSKTVLYEENFDSDNSPLKYRNFLAFSFSENSTNYFYIDNYFYVSSIKEMEYNHFLGKYKLNDDGKRVYEKPYKKNSSFYIKIIDYNSIEFKEKYKIK